MWRDENPIFSSGFVIMSYDFVQQSNNSITSDDKLSNHMKKGLNHYDSSLQCPMKKGNGFSFPTNAGKRQRRALEACWDVVSVLAAGCCKEGAAARPVSAAHDGVEAATGWADRLMEGDVFAVLKRKIIPHRIVPQF